MKFERSLGIAFLSLVCSVGHAQTYNVDSGFVSSFESVTDPDGVWSFGWTDGLGGPFTLFDATAENPGFNGGNELMWYSSSNNNGFSPSIGYNDGPAFNNGNVDFNADTLELTGIGDDGDDYAVVEFTAPSAGLYTFSGSFFGQQVNDNADFAILVNGAMLFDDPVGSDTDQSFDDSALLSTGDVLEFAAGPGSDFSLHPANFGLDLNVTGPPSSVPGPGALAPFGVGIAALLGRRKRR